MELSAKPAVVVATRARQPWYKLFAQNTGAMTSSGIHICTNQNKQRHAVDACEGKAAAPPLLHWSNQTEKTDLHR